MIWHFPERIWSLAVSGFKSEYREMEVSTDTLWHSVRTSFVTIPVVAKRERTTRFYIMRKQDRCISYEHKCLCDTSLPNLFQEIPME